MLVHPVAWYVLRLGELTTLYSGLTIQRKSHVDDAEAPPELRKKALRRPLWIIGFAVYISSNVFGSGG